MKNLLQAFFSLILTVVIFGFAASDASAQVANPNLKDAQNAATNAPDLTAAGAARIEGKNALKITIANKGKTTAEKAKITVYAL
ncbi:MAG: hypothetical protein M3209_08620 [Acidobacteriota bacterium]|nr:hypothetical protein [Acidobacteriota bacterium]